MGDTARVLEKMGVFALAKEIGFEAVVLDDLGTEGWIKYERSETHWLGGFYLAGVFHDADKIISTCCLKTHRFGGHFTLLVLSLAMPSSIFLAFSTASSGLFMIQTMTFKPFSWAFCTWQCA